MTTQADEGACLSVMLCRRLISVPERSTMRHCLTPLDFTVQELDELFDLAADIEANPQQVPNGYCERTGVT